MHSSFSKERYSIYSNRRSDETTSFENELFIAYTYICKTFLTTYFNFFLLIINVLSFRLVAINGTAC